MDAIYSEQSMYNLEKIKMNNQKQYEEYLFSLQYALNIRMLEIATQQLKTH
ncbi:hypothetical protein D6861_000110 [Macrococcoides caseolyticum]